MFNQITTNEIHFSASETGDLQTTREMPPNTSNIMSFLDSGDNLTGGNTIYLSATERVRTICSGGLEETLT